MANQYRTDQRARAYCPGCSSVVIKNKPNRTGVRTMFFMCACGCEFRASIKHLKEV